MKTVYHQQIAVKIHDKYALSLWSVSAHLYVILDILCELDDKSIKKKTMGGVCSVYFCQTPEQFQCFTFDLLCRKQPDLI